jgi:hypothetical protein
MSYNKLLHKGKIMKQFRDHLKTEYINTRDLAEFLSIIEEQNINFIIDIRYNTFFKTNQGFNPKSLKQVTKIHKIKYLYIQDLGNPSHKNRDNLEEAKTSYSNYLNNITGVYEYLHPKDKLEKLYFLIKNLIPKYTFCLICYCEPPKECHRFWLKEKLIEFFDGEVEKLINGEN